MKKWLWTFGGDTLFSKKYIIVNTDKGDKRDVLFQVYGKDNMTVSYLLDTEPYREEELREKYGLKKIAEWTITENNISVILTNKANLTYSKLSANMSELTSDFKHRVWDRMTGGV